jgi:hypothetical protein
MTREMVDGILGASCAIAYGVVMNYRGVIYGITRRKRLRGAGNGTEIRVSNSRNIK